jgi:tRNA U34 2-thiouridine synthase MnmA/TrmU
MENTVVKPPGLYVYRPGDIFVCKGATHPARYARQAVVAAKEFNWIAGAMPDPIVKLVRNHGLLNGGTTIMKCVARARYRQDAVPCSVTIKYMDERPRDLTTPPAAAPQQSNQAAAAGNLDSDDDITRWQLVITFDKPEIDVCPGQILVLYDGDVCLGGGPIKETVIEW